MLLRLGLAVIPSFADIVLYQGTFTDDSDVAQFTIDVTGSQLVTIESWGYAGGTVPTSPSAAVIPAGGFAPNAILFDPAGNEIASDNGGHCGITGTDAVTGNCDDPYFQEDLSAGSYTLALAEWDNVPADGILSDGFTQDGNPGFTCAEFGQTGNFCDVTTALGTVRTGNYAVSVTTADIVAAPEPTAFSLFGVAGCFFGALFSGWRGLNGTQPGER